jgi:hypothetical protein
LRVRAGITTNRVPSVASNTVPLIRRLGFIT